MHGKNKQITILFFLIFLISVKQGFAIPRVGIYKIEIKDIDPQIESGINDLVFSFVKELKDYEIVDCRDQPIPRDFPQSAGLDYIFYGYISSAGGELKLDMVLKSKEGDISRFLTRTYETANKILLDSRMIVRNLFDQSASLPIAESKPPPEKQSVQTKFSLDTLAGSWSGEKEINKIVIMRGGRGIAILSSGVSIPLTLSFSDSTGIKVIQKGNLFPRQFLDIPDSIAKLAVEKAKPLEWNFLINTDNKKLSGIKIKPIITYANDSITDISYIEEPVLWVRN
ncbi:NAD(P)-dependent oxidoreductase [Treponema phagedenis]|nr:NAD(P)-dependent oxidoreductase [Treponema phagedenis]EFW38213.1 hypothetical protein HMPREF9554_01282 [Treponema phagedenis F0421]NVP24612.1 NAD(P)-dependent oxidoreductase [Treponema phagedenis]QEJ94696.1 NAD(P)-dependent oxidoreductase [Treponema phagedenis]QEJ97632.1 NAD(P)-dependent oxidoreductase [Treponema phagedenis]QEK00600.1 NAD(P)-dependent oxidoreductase [Treponema phagedenis]